MLRFLTAGESHGRGLVVIVEGAPARLELTTATVAEELARRRLGFGRGPRMRFERDEVTLLAGVRHGRTLGSPIAIEIANTEWERWKVEMSPDPGEAAAVLTAPRPGHADLVGMQKYGLSDARDVLERASARETAARVAAGVVARAVLAVLGTSVLSHTAALGGVEARAEHRPGPEDRDRVDDDVVRCADPEASAAMVAAIEAAQRDGDSLGGVAEVLAFGVPVGLGSHVHWDRKLDGLLAQAVMSIQAVKGVELGAAAQQATLGGCVAHDSIARDPSHGSGGGFRRGSDRAGGLEGGMTTGSLLVVRATMKPLSTLSRPVLETVDLATGESATAFKERTDVTAVPAMGVVAEAMVALVLAGEALRKFGGDSVRELRRNAESYLADAANVAHLDVAAP